jgi:TonB family protein
MNSLLIYLLKVSAGTALFYFGYLLFFRKDTFYLRNRIFLMLTLIIPAILPLIKIPVISVNPVPAESAGAFAGLIYTEPSPLTSAAGAIRTEPFDIYPVLTGIYFAAAVLLLLRVIISLLSTYTIIKKGTIRTNHFPKVVTTESQLPPFSFFPYVVVPAEDFNTGECSDILDHEFAHIKQGHTFDLILGELFIAFQWFNPFVWLVKRSMILNHEYLADKVSLIKNKSVKEYQYRLLNLQPRLKHISLVHSFDSLIKNRIIMINKTPSPRFAVVKNFLILPIVAIALYAFTTPVERSSSLSNPPSSVFLQKEVRGIVLSDDGKPLEGASIISGGTPRTSASATTGADGRFVLYPVSENGYLSVSCRGYKYLTVKAVSTSEMTIKLEKDPEYKPPIVRMAYPNAIASIDGVLSDMDGGAIRKKMGDEIARVTILTGKAATDKYGEKGKEGVWEFMTWKKANELGIKIPVRRTRADDYPTFRGEGFFTFRDWVIKKLKYPAEAKSKRIEGWAHASYTVETDGSLSNIKFTGATNPVLGDALVKVIQSSPKWEPAKNTKASDPFTSEITLKFELPGKISDEEPYLVVEKMPEFPGDDAALIGYVQDHLKYPASAQQENIQGRVILRFIVSSKGKVEDVSVLKSVAPALDEEAIRVVKTIPDWIPATQGGIPRSVYFSMPVTFSLTAKGVSQGLITSKPFGLYKFINENIIYPQEAKNSLDTGVIYVIVRLTRGGITKDFTAVTDPMLIKVPLMDEVVVVAYKPSDAKGSAINKGGAGNDHPLLKAECLRIANKLTLKEIPEWENNNLEFAMKFKFIIK